MDTPAWIFAAVLLVVLIELLALVAAFSQTSTEKDRLEEERGLLALELARYRVQGSNQEMEEKVAENILLQLRPEVTGNSPTPHTSIFAHIFPK